MEHMYLAEVDSSSKIDFKVWSICGHVAVAHMVTGKAVRKFQLQFHKMC